jgi:alkylated DNA repair protein (DNA oxidative demethylase)
LDLFDNLPQPPDATPTQIAPGAFLLRGFALEKAPSLLQAIEAILQQAPLRHMLTPGGHTMSLGMSNCGALGWVSDTSGYRYSAHDPLSQLPWPCIPACLLELAQQGAAQAGYPRFQPEACLINRRNDRPQRYRLAHGDVVVWGGPSRLAYHGVAPLGDDEHALLGRRRINLTFRRVYEGYP